MKAVQVRQICARPPKRSNAARRLGLSTAQRREILAKTGGRCHVCGDRAGKSWQADHVLHHQLGGGHSIDNYLPICRECNSLRWSYSPRVMRLIMRLGVYAKREVRHGTALGEGLVRLLIRRLGVNRKRRRKSADHRNQSHRRDDVIGCRLRGPAVRRARVARAPAAARERSAVMREIERE